MLVIRLSRGGKANSPFYRIVVDEKRSKSRSGYLEVLGNWDGKGKIDIQKDKYHDWIKKGALPTKTVSKLVNGK